MPKPKYHISKNKLNDLKAQLENRIFYKISTKLDCKKVSQLIQEKTGKTVSESTLYRMFLWEGNQNTPYLHTLDIIAEYIGFKNWFELENQLIDLAKFQLLYGVLPNEQQYKSLLSINLNQGTLKPLYSFLEQFPSDLSFGKKILLGEDIYKSLLINRADNLEFFKQFHALPIIREGFFELLADPDFNLNNYEKGLEYYLRGIKTHYSKKSLQDFLFANSLLLRYYFLKGNKDKVLLIGKQLYLDLELTEIELDGIYIFPKIRYISYRLFYDFSRKGFFDYNYWEYLWNNALKLANESDLIGKRIIIHTILDVLQINHELQEKTFLEFTLAFPEIFSFMPSYYFRLSMNDKLRFLESNAAKNIF
jgi:hypothetical protein